MPASTTRPLTATSPGNGTTPGFWPWFSGAAVGYPTVWVGSSVVLGHLTGTADLPYGELLSTDATTMLTRVAVPQALALAGTLLWARRRMRLSDLLHQRSVSRTWWVLTLAGLTVTALAALLVNGLRTLDESAPNPWGLAVTTMVVGFAEEFMYRGALLEGARRHGLTEGAAWGASTLAFGALHLPNVFLGQPPRVAAVQFVSTALIGTGFYALGRATRRLPVNAVAHGLWDFAVGVMPRG